MKTYVVDASVVAKWFFPENHAEASRRLLSGRRRLLAPDLVWGEFGNVVWKRVGRGEITGEEAAGIVGDFLRLPLEVVPTGPLLPAALELALSTGRTVYDCLYLALAIDRGCSLVTGDERLVNALENTPLAGRLLAVSGVR